MATTKQQAIDAEIKVTNKRWCSSCQRTQPLAGGKKSTRMWRCAGCEQRRKRQPSTGEQS